jgi:hypothetical protein
MHFFGRFGLVAMGLSGLSFVGMLYFKYVFPWPFPVGADRWPPKSFVETPLPVLAVMFFLAGVLSILLGLMADLVMRTYYESQQKTTYLIRDASAESAMVGDGPKSDGSMPSSSSTAASA